MAKFWFLYARPGKRVLLYKNGDIVVCPTPLDMRLQDYRRCKQPARLAACHCLSVESKCLEGLQSQTNSICALTEPVCTERYNYVQHADCIAM